MTLEVRQLFFQRTVVFFPAATVVFRGWCLACLENFSVVFLDYDHNWSTLYQGRPYPHMYIHIYLLLVVSYATRACLCTLSWFIVWISKVFLSRFV